jgi:hypothetical protein
MAQQRALMVRLVCLSWLQVCCTQTYPGWWRGLAPGRHFRTVTHSLIHPRCSRVSLCVHTRVISFTNIFSSYVFLTPIVCCFSHCGLVQGFCSVCTTDHCEFVNNFCASVRPQRACRVRLPQRPVAHKHTLSLALNTAMIAARSRSSMRRPSRSAAQHGHDSGTLALNFSWLLQRYARAMYDESECADCLLHVLTCFYLLCQHCTTHL